MAFLSAVLSLSACLCACGSSGSSSSTSAASENAAASSAAASSDEAAASEASSSAATESVASANAEAASPSSASSESASAESSEILATSESAVTEALPGTAAEAVVEEAAEEAESEESSAEEVTYGAATGFDFVDECTDKYGNVTLYALTELKGWQLETLLDQQGYRWDESQYGWIRASDGANYSAWKETGVYTRETYDQMNEKGGAIVCIGLNVVAGYNSPQEALNGAARCVVEDSYFDDNNGGIAVFYGPSMKEYLAIINMNDEGKVLFMTFSKEAVATGVFDQVVGEQVGDSFDDIWKAVTGKDHYGH